MSVPQTIPLPESFKFGVGQLSEGDRGKFLLVLVFPLVLGLILRLHVLHLAGHYGPLAQVLVDEDPLVGGGDVPGKTRGKDEKRKEDKRKRQEEKRRQEVLLI